MSEKLCKDCKYVANRLSAWLFGWEYAKCGHRNVRRIGGRGYVDGVVNSYCQIERKDGNCGPAGNHWEAKAK